MKKLKMIYYNKRYVWCDDQGNIIKNNKAAVQYRAKNKQLHNSVSVQFDTNSIEAVNISKNELPREGLIPIKDVMNILGIKRTKIYDMINKGDIPKPKKLGKSSRWLAEDIWEIAYKI